MHVVCVMSDVPSPGRNGGAMTCWGVVQALLRHGHRVTIVLLIAQRSYDSPAEQQPHLDELGRAGVEVVPISHAHPRARGTARVVLRPRMSDFYATTDCAAMVELQVRRLQPDVLFAYDFDAVAALQTVEDIPRLGALGSWNPVSKYGRWRHATPRTLTPAYARATVRLLRYVKEYPFMIQLARSCDRVGHFAAHHAAWLREHGAPRCQYYRTPLIDPVSDTWLARRRAARRPTQRPRILMPGRLRATLTLAGLYLFVREILPRLESRLGADGFEVHIVGKDVLPASLAAALQRPSIRLRGFVDDMDAEFLAADVLLVPNPIPFSLRVRILAGFAYGCCVVAHDANAVGTPELVHGQNVLLANSGAGLADMVGEALADRRLREQLGRQARATYEQAFAVDTAGTAITRELETLARAPVSQAEPVVEFKG